jgi:FtsH-binding integral membrane protein
MALALLMTTAVAIGIYLLLGFGILPVTMYYPLLIGSIVGYLIVFIVINFRVIKQNKSAVVPFFVYAAMMGVLLSSIMISTSIDILVLAFGVSALLFGIMAGYGAVTKQNLHPMGSIALMGLLGSVILIPILWIWFNETLYWIVSFVMFGAIMLITAYDVWRINNISSWVRSPKTPPYSLLCSCILFNQYILPVVYFPRQPPLSFNPNRSERLCASFYYLL